VAKLVAPVPSPSKIEHPLVQAVAGEVSIVGALTTFWVETVRSRRETELYAFLSDVARAIEDLRSGHAKELDVAHVASADFAETMANVTELAVREQDKNKRDYLRRFVVNYSKTHRPDVSLRKVFFQFVAEFSGVHLLLLDLVYGTQRSLSDSDLVVLGEQLDRPEAVSFSSIARKLDLDSELVAVLAATLAARGLIDIKPATGNRADKTSRILMLPLARRFMAFLHDTT